MAGVGGAVRLQARAARTRIKMNGKCRADIKSPISAEGGGGGVGVIWSGVVVLRPLPLWLVVPRHQRQVDVQRSFVRSDVVA